MADKSKGSLMLELSLALVTMLTSSNKKQARRNVNRSFRVHKKLKKLMESDGVLDDQELKHLKNIQTAIAQAEIRLLSV